MCVYIKRSVCIYILYTERKREKKTKRDHGSMSLFKSNPVLLITPPINLAQGELFSELAIEMLKRCCRIHLMSYNMNNITNNGSWITAHNRSNFRNSLSGLIIHITELMYERRCSEGLCLRCIGMLTRNIAEFLN